MTVLTLNTTECLALQNASGQVTGATGIQATVEMWEAVAIILGTGLLASGMAAVFTIFRKIFYNDKDSLDTSFDAGGKVNAGLTATTLVSQWTWAATLLQSSTVAAKYGISGPFWYAAGATIQILLFSMLSVQLKTRAPGAKTFLQVINARFGKTTHKVFCVFALATNIIVTAMLMLGGAAVTTSMVKYISVEYATTLVAAIIGGYTFIGGLGATFYVSYFNTAIIYFILIIFIAKVYMDSDDPTNPLGSIDRVYDYLSCAKGPEGNFAYSYVTILSNSGLMFGLINIVGNFGTVFVDQSYWQSSVAAKPRQGVLGFLFGGLAWFAIPFAMATTMGLAYIALSTSEGRPLLSDSQVDEGLVAPVVASRLLGKTGELMMLTMVLMAVTSTGSAEVIAVTSILIYDVYGVYLRPYRRTTDANSCILCGKGRGRMANPRDKCVCTSMTHCAQCHTDDRNSGLDKKKSVRREYKCRIHGPYREYTEYLSSLKNWCLVWTTMSILPLTVILYMAQLSLGWVYLFMGILVGSAVVPITLCMCWGRLTGVAMIAGSSIGTLLALITWLAVASTYEGGLENFLDNTGKELSMLCGNLVAILSGGLITVVTSFITNRHYDKSQEVEIWENTRDIDNPLSPWTEVYAKELNLTGAHQLDNRPSLMEVTSTFRVAKLLANIGSVVLTLTMIVVWPACMVVMETMNRSEFTGWVNLSVAWAVIALIFVVIVPFMNEVWDLFGAWKVRHKVSCEEEGLVTLQHATYLEPQREPRVHNNRLNMRTPSPKLFDSVAMKTATESNEWVKDGVTSHDCDGGDTSGFGKDNHHHGDRTCMEPDLALEAHGTLGNHVDEMGSGSDDMQQPVF